MNNQIIEVDAPEMRLTRKWKTLGCGDPRAMMARDAMDFAKAVVENYRANNETIEPELMGDLAALIISKTGANAALFIDGSEPRLTLLPESILAKLKDRVENGKAVEVAKVWPKAA